MVHSRIVRRRHSRRSSSREMQRSLRHHNNSRSRRSKNQRISKVFRGKERRVTFRGYSKSKSSKSSYLSPKYHHVRSPRKRRVRRAFRSADQVDVDDKYTSFLMNGYRDINRDIKELVEEIQHVDDNDLEFVNEHLDAFLKNVKLNKSRHKPPSLTPVVQNNLNVVIGNERKYNSYKQQMMNLCMHLNSAKYDGYLEINVKVIHDNETQGVVLMKLIWHILKLISTQKVDLNMFFNIDEIPQWLMIEMRSITDLIKTKGNINFNIKVSHHIRKCQQEELIQNQFRLINTSPHSSNELRYELQHSAK